MKGVLKLKITISSNKIVKLKSGNLEHFPKYTTYLINQASQTAQATRPKIVGQLSDEYPNYVSECEEKGETPTLKGWEEYHATKYPDALNKSIYLINDMINKFKNSINKIDEELILEWAKDLLYDKTFYGFNIESTIKLYLIDSGLNIRDATPEDESKNIDLYINDKPYQIKPITLDYKQTIASYIDIPIIFYEKKGTGIVITFNDDYLEGLLNK